MRRRSSIVASMPLALSLPDVPTYVLFVVPLVVLLGYTVFGATGFGSSMISVPVLSHFFPLTYTVPLVTVTDAVAATSTVIRLRRLVAWREFGRLVAPMLIGVALGVTLLLKLPRDPALLALGVFVTAYGAYLLSRPRRLANAHAWLAWPIGVAGGAFAKLFGTGGPIYIIFLSARIEDKSRLRATIAIVVALSICIRLVLFAATGLLLDSSLLTLGVLLLPLAALGLWLGNRLHHALSRGGVLRLIAVLLVTNGVLLIVRTLASMRDAG
jgi:uncharacterized membrane protein YfcA